MAIETFYVPAEDSNPITAENLRSLLYASGLTPRFVPDESLLWVEFDGFQSRLLTNSGSRPLDLITLQYYGELEDEASLTDKLEEVLESNGYFDAENLEEDDDEESE